MFNEKSQCVFSLLCEILGSASDKIVPETFLRLLFRLSLHQLDFDPSEYFCLKFDDFLAESIHLRLVNFYMTRHFRFQSYLVIIFLYLKEENLQFPQVVFTSKIGNNSFNYMKLIMSEVYRVIFKEKLPKKCELTSF